MQEPANGVVSHYLRAGIPYEHGVEAMRSQWSYTSADPYAVHVTFVRDCGETVQWAFSRGLLLEALCAKQTERVGMGDVQFTTGDALSSAYDQITMHLRSDEDDSEVSIYVGRSELNHFTQESIDLVPIGAEAAIVDAQIDVEWESFAMNRPEEGY